MGDCISLFFMRETTLAQTLVILQKMPFVKYTHNR